MTGPEHYEESEAMLSRAERYRGLEEFHTAELCVSLAQAHATLALAAATALGAAHSILPNPYDSETGRLRLRARDAWEKAVTA